MHPKSKHNFVIKLKRKKVSNILFWFWFVSVIILAVIPKTPKSHIHAWGLSFRIDYMEHLMVYFLLGILFINKKNQDNKLKKLNRALFYMLWLGFAIATETVQIGIAGRSFNPNDMYYNIAGILLGLLVSEIYFNRFKKSRIEYPIKN